MTAVMDTLIVRVPGRKRTYAVHYGFLESNEEGKCVRNNRRKMGKSVFEKIAWSNNKVRGHNLCLPNCTLNC